MVATADTVIPATAGRFYFGMAIACALIAFLGFTPTYWAPLASGTLSETSLVHLHGLLFSAWALFFVVQAHFATSGRLLQHRALGLVGISLASAMLFVGLATAIHSAEMHIAGGFGVRAREFLIVPVTTILFFACAVGAAVANRRHPELHKRLMLVATISILMAAVARIVRFLRFGTDFPPGPPPIEMSVVPALGTDLLIVAAMLYDWRTRGRVHSVYWIAGGLWFATQFGRIPFSKTPQWQAIADWLLSF